MVIFDANFMLFLFHDELPAPIDPKTEIAVIECKERVELLITQLNNSKKTIVIPTPVLAEILVRADSAASLLVAKISKSSAFNILDFDARAAVEVAYMAREGLTKREKLQLTKQSKETYAKLKYDRQILAIAIVSNVDTIYTNDKDLAKLAEKRKIKAIGIHELEMPEQDFQPSFNFETDEYGKIRKDFKK